MAKLSIHAYVHCSVHSNDCFTMHFTSICLVTINLIIIIIKQLELSWTKGRFTISNPLVVNWGPSSVLIRD